MEVSKMGSRRRFDSDFKREAVRLVMDEGRKISEVAKNLGVHENLLYKWKRTVQEKQDAAFPGKGHQLGKDAEITALKKQLRNAEMERDILKKAVDIFSKTPK
jgi:transposase-like protein